MFQIGTFTGRRGVWQRMRGLTSTVAVSTGDRSTPPSASRLTAQSLPRSANPEPTKLLKSWCPHCVLCGDHRWRASSEHWPSFGRGRSRGRSRRRPAPPTTACVYHLSAARLEPSFPRPSVTKGLDTLATEATFVGATGMPRPP